MNRHAKAIVGRGPDQTIQPYEFGHTETKGISLWLRGLPPLVGTEDVKAATYALPENQRAKVHWTPPGADRSKARSIFFSGVAEAMAAQWAGQAAIEVAA